MKDFHEPGQQMYALMKRLWPICRSITGDGVRQTLSILCEQLPEMIVHEVPTGTSCYDWNVPKEWSINHAYILAPDGSKVLDFSHSNLHVVNYSVPVDLDIDLIDLQPHLHSLPNQPNAIPYVTSYYFEDWGFCLSHSVREKLLPGRYRVKIDSQLKDGNLTFGELKIPGESNCEVLISTYICHPSMANNELSGPCLAWGIARWLQALPKRRHSYRILFLPETIGSIYYISRHLEELKDRTIAGFVMTCVGDERAWSFMPSRRGNTLADNVSRHVLKHLAPQFKEYSYLDRGSDERQYCSPGVDLPVVSVMRSKYVTYPEYHTSLDNLEFVSENGLRQSYFAHQKIFEVLEGNGVPTYQILCEPKMSKRGLRPTTGKVGSANDSRDMMNLLAYADGTISLLDISELIGLPAWKLIDLASVLENHNLITISRDIRNNLKE
jgi:aminopeptidase-like protein